MRSTIICVDDEKMLLNMLYEQLESWFGKNYNIEKALNAKEALKILDDCLNAGREVSVFISDYIMPLMKGDELLTLVKDRDPKIKRIMLTGYSAIDGIVNAINKAGIYRYISKPWDSKDLMLTLLEAIKSYEQDKINAELSKNYETLYYKYQNLYNDADSKIDGLMKAFSLTCDLKLGEDETATEDIVKYCGYMADVLKLEEGQRKNLEISAMLRNVGKVALTENELKEFNATQKYSPNFNHLCNIVISSADRIFGEDISKEVFENIRYQYESFDGSGPFNLKGQEIPVGARILNIVILFEETKKSSPNLSLKELIVKFVTNSQTYLDNKLTSEFIKQLQANEIF